jgi:uncharacterized tellurite resistance protein B-like protein
MYDLETRKIAFRHHVLHTLIIADNRLSRSEVRIWEAFVPTMIEAGLMNDKRELTPAYEGARLEALKTLKSELSAEDKHALLVEFRDLCGSDRNLADTERATFDAAATVLDVDLEEAWALMQGGD